MSPNTPGQERLAEVIYLPGARPPASSGESDLLTTPTDTWVEMPSTAEIVGTAEIVSVADDLESSAIREVCLKALSRRDHSRRELRELLAEFQEVEIDRELSDLERLGYLDEQRLADTIVENLVRRKGLGSSAIRLELQKRKLESEAISRALETIDRESERERAIEFLQKKAARLGLADREGAIRRLSGQLARRGFDADTVRSAISQVLRSSSFS